MDVHALISPQTSVVVTNLDVLFMFKVIACVWNNNNKKTASFGKTLTQASSSIV